MAQLASLASLYAKYQKDPESLSGDEIIRLLAAEEQGGLFDGELPIANQLDREKALDSPAYLATEIIDPWYKEHFERCHYQLLDEVMAPWVLGETVRIEGVNYEPKGYTGLLVLWSRSTIKSTSLKLLVLWDALYKKIRQGKDARTAYVHQVLEKAISQGDSIRDIARVNKKFQSRFPDFVPPKSQKEWDTKKAWRWPCFGSYLANEYSFTAYGESSSKIGGHYLLRAVDDWVTDEAVTTPEQLNQSERRFRAMDQLRDRAVEWNPWIAVGTHYHYSDAYKRIERRGGWLVWKLPGHKGSPKAIFDLLALDTRTEAGRRKIERGLVDLETARSGDLNFPNLLPWRELYRTARSTEAEDEGGLGGSHFEYNTQILLDPIPEGEWRFHHGDLDAAWEDTIPHSAAMHLFIRVDPATGTKRENDEVAINLGGVDWRGHRWFIDGWSGREKRPSEVLRKVFYLAKKWDGLGYKVLNIGIEAVQAQEGLAQMARDGVAIREPTFDGESVPMMRPPCPVVSITRSPDARKVERIITMEGPVSRREIHVWKANPIGAKLLGQYKEFPHGRFDILDTCHDMWLSTRKPPKATSPDQLTIPPEFEKILARAMLLGEERPTLTGLSNEVQLSSW